MNVTNITDSNHEEAMPMSVLIVFATLSIVLGAFTLVTNSVTLTAVVKYHRMETTSSKFVISLLVADLFLVLFVPLHLLIMFNKSLVARQACAKAFQGMVVAATSVQMSLLLAVVDRFVAICFPLRYHSIMTNTVANIGIVVCWMYSLMLGLIPDFLPGTSSQSLIICGFRLALGFKYRLLFCVSVLAISVILLVINGYIMCVVVKQRQVDGRHLSQNAPSRNNHSLSPISIRNLSVFISSACVTLLFTVCAFPYFILQFMLLYYKGLSDTQRIFVHLLRYLVLLNAGLNPLVYVWKNNTLKRCVQRLFRRPVERVNSFSLPSIRREDNSNHVC